MESQVEATKPCNEVRRESTSVFLLASEEEEVHQGWRWRVRGLGLLVGGAFTTSSDVFFFVNRRSRMVRLEAEREEMRNISPFSRAFLCYLNGLRNMVVFK
ncbi:Uncharacterized protein Fot_10912 [Forsythia ovata]|uniref:Uncharacterized protein n=1 Tax=Forsythia ovata TaxID=205694 RepID=A0ABD1WIF6_9LAMI